MGMDCGDLANAQTQIDFLIHNWTFHRIQINPTTKERHGVFRRSIYIFLNQEDINNWHGEDMDYLDRVGFTGHASYAGIVEGPAAAYVFRWR